MNKRLILLALMIIVIAGYPMAQAKSQDQKPLLEYVQNLQEAKAILKPESKWLMIARDPFNPLIVVVPREPMSYGAHQPVAALGQADDQLDDVNLIGIVRLDQEYRAYIMVGNQGRVVNVQDKIRKFIITKIDMDQVVFKSGNKEIIKKRGKP